MNTCQMSDNSNRSAPSSPAGTVAAHTTIDQQATDNQQTRLSRSRSLSDISQGDSPREDQQQPQLQAEVQHLAPDSLKVKIKTHNISTNNISPSKQEGSNNNRTNNDDGPTTNNKVDEGNNKTGKSKSSNGGNNNITSDRTGSLPLTRDNDSSGTEETSSTPTAANMNSNVDSPLIASNGKSSVQQPAQSPAQPTPPAITQQQIQNPTINPPDVQASVTKQPAQQPALQPPLPPPQHQPLPPTQTTAIPSSVPPQQTTPKSDSKKSNSSPATSAESKPKTTRARKQAVQTAKGSAASSATTTPTPATPKPESKRSKKAKQNADATNPSKSAPVSAPQSLPPIPPAQSASTTTPNSKNPAGSQQTPPTPSTKKRKPRAAAAANSAPSAAKPTEAAPPAASPPKRTRKKKGEPTPSTTDSNNNPPQLAATNVNIPPLNVAHPQLLSVASNVPMGASPLMSSAPLPPMQQPNINRQMPGISPLDVHDPANRYYSLTISPYANYDYSNAASLTRPSLNRLFTSSASTEIGHSTSSHSDEISKAFEDLRDNTWSHLSKCILEQAQQFDIPSLIGTLYTLRSENDKLTNKVRDLTNKRDQLIAMNARLDLPGPMLTQHLNHTSPNFSSIVAGLTNSPKSLPNSSPSPAMNKSPIVPGGSYNHVPPINSLGPPGFIDRNSPLIGLQTPHSGVNSLKSSTISTPSPPTGALMAHGANNRASLMTVNNPPYMSNVHPSLNALNQLSGSNPPGSSYYPRQ